jgi:hypothetical protein
VHRAAMEMEKESHRQFRGYIKQHHDKSQSKENKVKDKNKDNDNDKEKISTTHSMHSDNVKEEDEIQPNRYIFIIYF